MNEMKREEKPKEKRRKRNEQSLQEVWDYVKRPNLRLIGVPESEGENGTKLENTLQDIIQENFPNLVGQANIQIQEIQRTPQRYSSRRATPRHIIARFTKVEMKEKILWVTRPFSLAALKIFSFISTLVNLAIICLGVALLEEYLCGVLCIS
uniref:Uncharacterized protein n=1 Tax=Papio anubis TaxID=9555 RepID=A0A8I5P3T5_PAPAN